MTRIAFTPKQLEILKTNKCIESCTPNQVRFKGDFKIYALKLNKEGVDTRYIFKSADLPDFICDSMIPVGSIRSWKEILRTKGKRALYEENRGRKQKAELNRLTDKEKIAYLEAENAYLRDDRNFLI